MKDFNREEEKIRDVLKPLRGQRPPAQMMKNFETEVLAKLDDAAAPGMGLLPVFVFGFALAAAAVFGWMFFHLPVAPQEAPQAAVENIAEAPALVETSAAEAGAAQVKSEEVQVEEPEANFYEQVSEDLFILEWLGEDEGLLDDLDRLTADVEWMGQLSQLPAIA